MAPKFEDEEAKEEVTVDSSLCVPVKCGEANHSLISSIIKCLKQLLVLCSLLPHGSKSDHMNDGKQVT